MAKPIRIDTFTYESEHLINGMFIFNKKNNSNNDEEELAVILHIQSNKFYILFDDKKIYFMSDNLKDNVLDGDILSFHKESKKISTYLTNISNENTIMVTERCNSRCLFCCQPPKNENDEYLFDNAYNAIINFDTNKFIGISGGEPTYNKNIFYDFLHKLNKVKNTNSFHILTNGKSFEDYEYTKRICKESIRDIIWAIPIYGFNSIIHDKIVATKGSFDKTTKGIINLLEFGQKIEIRIIPNQLNIHYIENIIDYIFSTFKIVNSISIMNIEPIGYAKKNYEELYLKVEEQNGFLKKAILKARLYGFKIFLYNYPLCILDEEIREYAVKSISDWKNYYPPECDSCSKKIDCCGFFTSATDKYIEKVNIL
jgi:His-Xaa-Ser system radical SAM maturase HxsC